METETVRAFTLIQVGFYFSIPILLLCLSHLFSIFFVCHKSTNGVCCFAKVDALVELRKSGFGLPHIFRPNVGCATNSR